MNSWPKISDYIQQSISSDKNDWRNFLRQEAVSFFSKPLAESLLEKFHDNSEAKIIKDIYFEPFGSVAVKLPNLPSWYYPYSLLRLATFNIDFQDLYDDLERKNEFITLERFIKTTKKFTTLMNANLKLREIEMMKVIIKKRNKSSTLSKQFLSYKQAGQLIGLRRPERAKIHWNNVTRFLTTRIMINPTKIGLLPHFIRHRRELTPLEKKFTYYSFIYPDNYYYSLVLIPEGSVWLQQNLEEDSEFISLDKMDLMEYSHNLTHFTAKKEGRWGRYPGLNRSTAEIKSDISLDLASKNVFKPRMIDLQIMQELAKNVGRQEETANFFGVSTSYFNQRVTKMAEKEVIVPKVDLYHVGLEIELFLSLIIGEEGTDVIKQARNALVYFPHVIIFSNKKSLFAKLKMPARWLYQYQYEFDELSTTGGRWYEQKVKTATRLVNTRASLRNSLIDFTGMINELKTDRGYSSFEWKLI
ncbi:MAG: hypothetical protein ACFFD4_17175 [Candidatus Odinarchaeota archaeon]